uniref:Chromosome 12 open reading frame 45 n=2 Tax=Nothobranchius furzeri TaxID=105023 RepID=A0A1A8VDD6_NOTFU
MDQNAKKTTSRSLLSCGNEGALSEKLLLKRKAGKSLKTERVPRSSMLERLQNFLPQMAEANMKLTQQMEKAPPGHFDIENVDKAEKVIEMDVALLELNESDSYSEEDEETSDSEEDLDSEDGTREITEQNLKLPGDLGRKQKVVIQVLERQGD